MDRRTWLTLAPLAAVLSPGRAAALATEEFGSRPLPPGDMGLSADAMAVANLACRVYFCEVNGNPWFYYRGDAGRANDALAVFAKLNHPKRQVRLAAGPGTHESFRKQPVAFDFQFHVPAGFAAPTDATAYLQVQVTEAAAPPAAADRVKALAAALDAPRFADRDAATRELAKLGRAAKTGLLTAKAATTSAEVRGRIDALLAKLTGTEVADLDMPAGLAVAAADEPAKPETTAIRDDIARLVAARTRPEARK